MKGLLASIERAIGKRRAARSSRCSSTAALGLRVEREIAEWAGVAKQTGATTYANGKKKPYQRLHRFTRAVLELLEREQLSLTHFQHPVTSDNMHTKLDFIARSNKNGDTMVLELKTGMDQHTKTARAITLSDTEEMPDTPLSRAIMQAGIGGMLYERARPCDQSTLLSMWNHTQNTLGTTLRVRVKVATIVVNRKQGAKIHYQTPKWRQRTELLFQKILVASGT